MSLINIANLSFTHENSYEPIFENISLQLDTNWKLGLMGRNGKGKTTLLQLLLGNLPYQGSISAKEEFVYFPFEITEPQRFTYEIIDEFLGDYEFWKLQKELSLLSLPEELLYQPFATLSGGEQVKMMLAILFLKEQSFLLIDEPTNHLDVEGRELVSQYLNSKKGYILVSHDRTFLNHCIDHVLSINRKNIELQKGNFDSWYANKELQDQFYKAQNEKLSKEVNRLSKAAKQTKNWSDKVEKSKNGTTNSGSKLDKGYVGHKSAKMMKRSKSTQQRQSQVLQEKSALLNNLEELDDLQIKPLVYHSQTLLRLQKISLFYGEKTISENLTFTIEQGDRIALQGRNGSGKSTLLKLLHGEDITYTGEKQQNNNLRISYVSQDTSHLKGSLTQYSVEQEIEESLFKTILRKLGFERIQLENTLENLSQGQKKKVLLAKSLCQQAHLYLWDEPLNFIDVFSRMQIEQLLKTYQPTLVFVEHDVSFTQNIATKQILL